MNIEVGELFVVTRGVELNDGSAFYAFAGLFGDAVPPPKKDRGPQYDRSYEGNVYVANEVCGPVIAATCVFGSGYHSRDVGETISFNTREIEVWPVTHKYLDSLKPGNKVKQP